MTELHKKGTICLRCGVLKKDKDSGCVLYGLYQKNHVWNKEEVEIEVQFFKNPDALYCARCDKEVDDCTCPVFGNKEQK